MQNQVGLEESDTVAPDEESKCGWVQPTVHVSHAHPRKAHAATRLDPHPILVAAATARADRASLLVPQAPLVLLELRILQHHHNLRTVLVREEADVLLKICHRETSAGQLSLAVFLELQVLRLQPLELHTLAREKPIQDVAKDVQALVMVCW